MHTTCPNHFCNYKAADLHETDTHVVIYCQSCGYEEEHKRKSTNKRSADKPRWDTNNPFTSKKSKNRVSNSGAFSNVRQAI